MTRAPQPRISRKLLVLFMPVAFILAPLGGPPAAAAAAPKALINEATVSGGTGSQEALIATAAGFEVTVASDAAWSTMTASDFAAYDLLIAGDPTCGSLPPGLISSASTYGPVVLGRASGRTLAGNRIVVGTDPVFHDTGPSSARAKIISDGIAFAGSRPGTTGMYFDATCAGGYSLPADLLSILDALSAGAGSWSIDSAPPCGGSVALIASHPSFADLTTASLQGWGCSVHESFPTFKGDWSALAVATDTPSHPTCGVDPGTGASACGEAYILIAGANIVVSSQGISVTPLDATNPTGTSHTVTANVHNTGGPLNGKLVTFSVTGQNAGASGSCAPNADCTSGADGNVSFTYADTNGAGDDTIKASFTDETGSLQTATAQKHWVSPPPAHLTLAKVVVNTGGGTSPATAWTLSATSPTGPTSISGPGGVSADVPAGTYALAESGGPTTGYRAGSWSCSGGSLAGNSLTLTAGNTASCSITNTFIPPTTCTRTSCSAQTTSPDGTVAAITAGPGSTITASFSTLAAAGFAGCTAFPLPPSLARSVLTLDVTGSRWPKLIKWVEPGTGPIRICWNAPTPFRQRGGGMSPADGIAGYSGVLPDCLSLRPTLPCVSPTVKKAGVRTIWILAPAGDPHGY